MQNAVLVGSCAVSFWDRDSKFKGAVLPSFEQLHGVAIITPVKQRAVASKAKAVELKNNNVTAANAAQVM